MTSTTQPGISMIKCYYSDMQADRSTTSDIQFNYEVLSVQWQTGNNMLTGTGTGPRASSLDESLITRTTTTTTMRDDTRRGGTTRTTSDGRWLGWWCSHHPACRCVFAGSSSSTTNIVGLMQVPSFDSFSSRPRPRLVLFSSWFRLLAFSSRLGFVSSRLVSSGLVLVRRALVLDADEVQNDSCPSPPVRRRVVPSPLYLAFAQRHVNCCACRQREVDLGWNPPGYQSG